MKLRWIAALAAVAFWCVPTKAQDFVQSYNFVNTGTNGPTTSFANTGVTSFFISWSPQVSLSACSIQVDSSSDGASWGSGDLIASTSCTTAGSSAAATLGAGKNFVRIHVTALTGNGGLNVTMKGWGGGGSGGGISTNLKNAIDLTNPAYAGGSKADWVQCTDASFTLNSNIVFSSTGACNFSATTDIGKEGFGTQSSNCSPNVPNSLVLGTYGAAQPTVVAVIDSTHIQMSQNATATNPGCFVFGTNDDAVAAAAEAVGSVSSTCPLYLLPAKGFMGFDNTHFTDESTACGTFAAQASTGLGMAIVGANKATSGWFVTPALQISTKCTHGTSGNSCFGAAIGGNYSNFTINGGDSALAAVNSGTHNLFECRFGCTMNNVAITGWDHQDQGSTVGLHFIVPGGGAVANGVVVDGAGKNCGDNGALGLTVSQFTCFDSLLGFQNDSGQTYNSTGSAYSALGTGQAFFTNNGIYHGVQDAIVCDNACPANAQGLQIGPGATAFFSHSTSTVNSSAGLAIYNRFSNSTLHISDSTVTSGSTVPPITNAGTIFDECGNTLNAGLAQSGGTVYGSCSITGTAFANANAVLSANFGTSAAVSAATGNSQNFTFTVTNGTAATGASPTITITFPKAFWAIPARCSLWQVGGTQAVTATTAILPPSSLTATGVVFTYPATPTINLTEFYQGSCGN